jgi:heptosyltransferase-1
MGDILHALPAITALRQAHPRWVIDWVVEPGWSALLSSRGGSDGEEGRDSQQPVVDRLHFAATKAWRQEPLARKTRNEVSGLRQALQAGNYDAVLDLQGALRSAVIGRMSGCRRRIGEAEPREQAARWLFTEHIRTQGAHVIEQDVELASAVAGDDLAAVLPLLPMDPAAETWCDGLFGSGARQAVLLNPGAGWGAKRWPVERYASVAKAMAGKGLRVLVNAGPGEENLAQAIRDLSGGVAEELTCSLSQLIALTRRASLLIAGDTGPLHLACALGRPVVGIYGPTDPARNGPYGTRFRVLRSPESRRDHSRRPEPEAGLLTITPEAVVEAAEELLGEERVV